MDLNDILNRDEMFRYMLLDRMRHDCEYYLGFGNRQVNHLWGEDEKEHIECMKAIWNSFEEGKKPEWLPMEKIEEYESSMVAPAVPFDDKLQDAVSRASGQTGSNAERSNEQTYRM